MNARLWVKLQLALGAGSPSPKKLFESFGGIGEIFGASVSELERVIPHGRALRLCNGDFAGADRIIGLCRDHGINIVCYDDPAYPVRLKNIYDPPAVLYCMGELPQMDDEVAVAVVGTRRPDEYGVKAGFSLAARLTLAGALIVSGGAVGVDSEAHRGALAVGGRTVAVLGCGLLAGYLKSNAALREQIKRNGALVSEYPPEQPAYKSTFPIRNRVMSGLCLGTAVIEAGEKSGALITARLASEQGRDVFVVPGQPGNKLFDGANLLLRDGAKPLLSALDVLEEYADRFPHKLDLKKAFENADKTISDGFRAAHAGTRDVPPAKPDGKTAKPAASRETPEKAEVKPTVNVMEIPCSDPARKVLSELMGGGMCADEIAARTGLGITEVTAALTELEIFGAVSAVAGGRYIVD